MRSKTLLLFLLSLALLALVAGGCKDDDNPTNTPPPTSTTYTGVMAGVGVSGTVAFVIPTAKLPARETMAEGDTIVISGTLKLNGGSEVTLTGFLVVATGQIYASGGGYVFNGTVADGHITGVFTYSGGSGFFTCDEGTSSTIKSYCGSYHENSPGTESGTFNMTINGTHIGVIVYPDGEGQAFVINGTYNPSTYAITIYLPENPEIPVAQGTLNPTNNTVSGTSATGDNGGTWSGSLCH